MKIESAKILGALSAIAFFCMTVTVSNAGVIKSYDFNGDLSDTLGNGVDLIASGGTISGGRYSFGLNQGLKLNSALLDTSNYGVEFRVRVNDSLSSYNKLLDFQDLGSDLGLYILNGQITFYTTSGTGGSLPLGSDFTLGFERAAGTVRIWVDNALILSFSDSGQAVSGPNILNFFEDDFSTGQSEAFEGSVDWIRIHEDSSTFGLGAVPEPTSLAIFGAICILGSGRRRKA